MQPGVVVVAAVIEREGRILVCRRAARDSHPLKWEFPGGKVQAGEHPRQALRRELREELGVEAEIGEELARYQWQYPGKQPIQLVFYRAQLRQGEPENRVFAEIRWEGRERLAALDFLEADRDFVRRLASGREL